MTWKAGDQADKARQEHQNVAFVAELSLFTNSGTNRLSLTCDAAGVTTPATQHEGVTVQ